MTEVKLTTQQAVQVFAIDRLAVLARVEAKMLYMSGGDRVAKLLETKAEELDVMRERVIQEMKSGLELPNSGLLVTQ